ncbi:hypothetical protein L249_4527 [Ophiocordyceps polyrhachis-furcata BCC 54312]|uniref:Small ribosomal subunit protein uS9m n=1 Tax=Ophiocordyceps polyrhachis-furcata BCC 54312 TaxID=1330021 RepID=A0A367KZ47_9HYPO|nr:hypothetical protein L249_4527 [Ophiocordyceps polyrhachis-furcata BCC 54312]
MASIGRAFGCLRCRRRLKSFPWHRNGSWWQPSLSNRARALSTDLQSTRSLEMNLGMKDIRVPFEGIQHVRAVPTLPSYFSREPKLNEIHIRLMKLLLKYNALPVCQPGEDPTAPWAKIDDMRAQLGEPFKAANFAKVKKLARRLNAIHPSLAPKEVRLALRQLMRDANPTENKARPGIVDQHGRAIGVGKRKESTARAFVLEGTGEVLINGKTLSEAFGRVHDRESAIWALTATNRLDKYNVWAVVEGGGTTGRAEALALAVAKALVVHEPALKNALRKAGCISRDYRAVERKKHGHLKARKMPAWVKR